MDGLRASLGGDTLRVRLSNAYGSRKLVVGAARIGMRDTGPNIVPGSDRKLTFGGAETATVAAGALLVSDPVSLPLPPLGDLAISVYLPGDLPASVGITGRYSRLAEFTGLPALPLAGTASVGSFRKNLGPSARAPPCPCSASTRLPSPARSCQTPSGAPAARRAA